jgi:hypothetical protein
VKDAFAKKFFGVGRDSAGGALASILRPLAAEDAVAEFELVHKQVLRRVLC